MPTKDKRLKAFWHQQFHCRRRGIEFHFTFDEWVAWWEKQLGRNWMSKRGIRSDQYVMARKGDKGSYRPSNVICITMAQNTYDAHIGTKQSPETVAKRSGPNHWMNRSE
jgi:hypothetical protein